MAQKLRLYRHITPNEGRNTHYIFRNASDYLEELESERVGAILTLDNFRINNNVAKITAGQVFEEIMSELTYIIVYDDDTKYFRAYWVTSSALQSGYLILNLRVDLWASSIMGAQFTDMHVTRCNREIDEGGYFDPIRQAKATTDDGEGNLPAERLQTINLPISDLAVVFKLQFNASQNLFGGQVISETRLFYVTAQTLYDAIRGAVVDGQGQPTGEYDAVNIVEKAINWLGGVYSISGTLATLPAQVVRAWLVPLSVVESEPFYTSLTLDGVRSKSTITKFEDCILNVRPVHPLRYVKHFDMLTILSHNLADPWTARDGIARYNWAGGTPFNGLNLSRRVHMDFSYIFAFEVDDLKVLVDEGGRQADISRAFELAVTGNNSLDSTLVRLLNAIGYGLGVSTSIAKGAMGGATGGTAGMVAGAVFSALGATSNLLSKAVDERPLSQVATGDGAGTYAVYTTAGNRYVQLPYRLTRYESVQDEIENANENGVNYDCKIKSLNEPTAKRLVVSSTWYFEGAQKTFTRTDETFIAIDEMTLYGCQEDAKAFIKDEFRRGIFYKIITARA